MSQTTRVQAERLLQTLAEKFPGSGLSFEMRVIPSPTRPEYAIEVSAGDTGILFALDALEDSPGALRPAAMEMIAKLALVQQPAGSHEDKAISRDKPDNIAIEAGARTRRGRRGKEHDELQRDVTEQGDDNQDR